MTKKKVLLLITICIISLTLVGIFFAAPRYKSAKVNRFINDGRKYLIELSYDQAIASFEVAISIDPKSEGAYMGLADVYVAMAEKDIEDGDYESAMNNYQKAINELERGYENTGSEEMQKRIKEIEELMVVEEPEEEPVQEVPVEETDEYEWVLVKQVNYYPDGSLSSKFEYEYDSSGNQINDTWSLPNGKFSRVEYEYDSAGNKVSEKCVNYDGTMSRGGKFNYECEYEYDITGNMISEINYKDDGMVDFLWEYEYDSAGNMIKGTKFSSAGLPTGEWWDHEYNDKGDMTKFTVYSSDGKISNWGEYEYEYDNSGKKIKVTLYMNGETSLEECEYDSDGKLKKVTGYDSGGSIMYWTEYEYNQIKIAK